METRIIVGQHIRRTVPHGGLSSPHSERTSCVGLQSWCVLQDTWQHANAPGKRTSTKQNMFEGATVTVSMPKNNAFSAPEHHPLDSRTLPSESLRPKTLENVTHMPKRCLWAVSRATPNMIAVRVWDLRNMSPCIPKPWKTSPACPSSVFGRSPEPHQT